MTKETQGLETYTPTRLEWLCVYLNSVLPDTILQINGIQSMFLVNDAKDNIIFRVRHYSDVDDKKIKNYVESVEGLMMEMVKQYKWESWFKHDVEYHKVERESSRKVPSDS